MHYRSQCHSSRVSPMSSYPATFVVSRLLSAGIPDSNSLDEYSRAPRYRCDVAESSKPLEVLFVRTDSRSISSLIYAWTFRRLPMTRQFLVLQEHHMVPVPSSPVSSILVHLFLSVLVSLCVSILVLTGVKCLPEETSSRAGMQTCCPRWLSPKLLACSPTHAFCGGRNTPGPSVSRRDDRHAEYARTPHRGRS